LTKPVQVREVRVPSVQEGLISRAAEVAEELRAALLPIVEECAGSGRRPAVLARTLKIDRTLAARVLRSIRAGDSVQSLHEIPAPGGLRIFLDAAKVAGVEAEWIGRAAKSVRRFEQLIDEFPGGRAALDAALGGFDESVRQRSSRAAAQAIHRSMTSLLGYQADVMLGTVIIQPSESGDLLDTVYLLGKLGVRRLRASSPITVFGWRGEQLKGAPLDHRVETIDGQIEPENGNAYLLTDFCTRPTPPVSLFHSGNLYLYTLAESVPPLNTPVDLVSAHVVRNNGLRYGNDHATFHWETHTPRFPCKVLLADVFVREDVFPGRAPVLTTRLHSIATGAARPDAPAFQLDNVDLAPPVLPLGMGLGGVGSRDIASYREMLDRAFGQVGWDPSRFRGYRCRIQYPVPLVSVTFWFDLPVRPAGVE
jgi:hypothetical protein